MENFKHFVVLVEELICRTVEYGEVKIRTNETISKVHIEPDAPKFGRKKPKTLQSPALVAKARK